jgi:hypothetical protein
MMALLYLAVVGVAISGALTVTVQEATVTEHNNYRRTEAKTDHASNLYEYVSQPQPV